LKNDQFWTKIIYVISIAISAAVAFLILGPRPQGIEASLDVSMLPAVNATINGITLILLIMGLIFIVNKKRELHRNTMLLAFGSSTLFLITYIIYHWYKSGPKLYEGDYVIVYYFILISHIILASIIIPLALFTLYRGWMHQLSRHRKIARITFPIWVYVSITGVVIYWMLYF
jgi:putative membrane protein